MTLGIPLILVSCGAKKNLVKETPVVQKMTEKSDKAADALELKKLSFVQKVSDNSVYAANIVGDLRFNIKAGGKDITVPGSLHMRKNQVIRIQLFIPILGSEVGRLEFTPDYVLVIDRMHKEYIKATYDQLDFLKDNGFEHYEISNFAKEGQYSRHNSNYWKGVPYLGLGPSAHSYNGGSRRWNVSALKEYIRKLSVGLWYEEETLTPVQKYNEYVMTSLRTMWGCDSNKINKDFGSPVYDFF